LAVLKGSERILREIRSRILIGVRTRSMRRDVAGLLRRFGCCLIHEKVNFSEPLISVLYFMPYRSPSGYDLLT
jgi:hypothetical protein